MTAEVIVGQSGHVGRLTLNRPEALHALNDGMCQAMLEALTQWRDDPSIMLVMIDHMEDTRGFCAGGDIRMLASSGASDGAEARAFFATEYRLNAMIKAFPKPFVAIIDGITMGGGVGIAAHGSHRIATERTNFAMPETGIGLFPDVGGGWFLPRLTGELGMYLALTGARLKGADVVAAGVATHLLPSELINNLKIQIETADYSAGPTEMLNEILRAAAHPVGEGSFEANMETINACFAFDEAEAIIAALTESADPWAEGVRDILLSRSPETVKVSMRQLREGGKLERFEDNMAMEYRIGWRKVQSKDFLEGVRAVIIDKDHAPVWSPATLEEVSEADVARYFEPLGNDELTF